MIEQTIATMSGVSKRLFMALSDFRGRVPALEDALFQMAAVVDCTSKFHYPGQGSKRRFVAYLESVAEDLFWIASAGRLRLQTCTFLDSDGNDRSFGEVLYGIRCSSYHDPNEVDALIHWGSDGEFGVTEGKFIVNEATLKALFLILLSDEANVDHIDRTLFGDDQYLTVGGVNHPFHSFVGARPEVFRVLGLSPGSESESH